LGEGLQERGTISEDAISRTADAINGMLNDARSNHCLAVAAVGTAGLRIAQNASDVVQAIESRTGIRIEVISGDEEGRLAYLAVQAGLHLGQASLLEFDSGGGSSQFTFGKGEQVMERFSLDVGAVRYTERFGLDGVVTPDRLNEARAAIASDLSRLDQHPQPDALVGMGGTVTNLTAVSLGMATYDPDAIQGAVLTRSEIERQIELYRTKPAAERRQITGLQPKRADIILSGACIVLAILDKAGRNSLTVSDRGLRHGLLVERFGK
jgi:exopolyphosphatase/guanosine-5'-triphosphate,3'-diphosphate pyrophosphatase